MICRRADAAEPLAALSGGFKDGPEVAEVLVVGAPLAIVMTGSLGSRLSGSSPFLGESPKPVVRFKVGGQVTSADASYLRAYRERRACEAELAVNQDRVRRGQEALAVEAFAR